MLDGLHLVGRAGLGWEVTGTQELVVLKEGSRPGRGGAKNRGRALETIQILGRGRG